jgi:hypothetical protein
MSLSGPRTLILHASTIELKGAISSEPSLDMVNITLWLLLDMILALAGPQQALELDPRRWLGLETANAHEILECLSTHRSGFLATPEGHRSALALGTNSPADGAGGTRRRCTGSD